jgi:SAM-dependent methyltransferase
VKRESIPHPGPPSKFLIDVADELTGLSQHPVLDAGCGFGRNAVALASRGLSVVCVDRNRERLNSFTRSASARYTDLRGFKYEGGRLHPVHAELKHSQWPFSQNCFGAIICVHFLDTDLLTRFGLRSYRAAASILKRLAGTEGTTLIRPRQDSYATCYRMTFIFDFIAKERQDLLAAMLSRSDCSHKSDRCSPPAQSQPLTTGAIISVIVNPHWGGSIYETHANCYPAIS